MGFHIICEMITMGNEMKWNDEDGKLNYYVIERLVLLPKTENLRPKT